MPSYTIANQTIENEILQKYFDHAKLLFPIKNWNDLNHIFNVACKNRDRFPSINLQGKCDPEHYIERWVKGYYDATNNPPSKRTANPKSTCTDPAIRVIVKSTRELSEKDALFGEITHNLFMSAENIQGKLLEEYIALKVHPYGFIWCDGNVLRAIDFCNTNGTLFLQIKNKSNTENSSSSNIREGTSIEMWYRLGTKTKDGLKFPNYKWPLLNTLINTYKTDGFKLPPCNMTEKEYQEFLKYTAALNHNLITDK